MLVTPHSQTAQLLDVQQPDAAKDPPIQHRQRIQLNNINTNNTHEINMEQPSEKNGPYLPIETFYNTIKQLKNNYTFNISTYTVVTVKDKRPENVRVLEAMKKVESRLIDYDIPNKK